MNLCACWSLSFSPFILADLCVMTCLALYCTTIWFCFSFFTSCFGSLRVLARQDVTQFHFDFVCKKLTSDENTATTLSTNMRRNFLFSFFLPFDILILFKFTKDLFIFSLSMKESCTRVDSLHLYIHIANIDIFFFAALFCFCLLIT